MIKTLLLSGLFSSILFAHACESSAAADDLKNENEQIIVKNQPAVSANASGDAPKIERAKTNSQTVNFKGVSFNYNPQIFGAVKMKEVVEQPLINIDDKPDYVSPRNRLFTFDLSTEFSEMYIAVYPVDDFPRMYSIDEESVEGAVKENENLKKVLKDKNFRVENQIPYLPFIDAHQSFQAKVRHSPFQSGKGIFFLTFWDTEIELPSNRNLRYIFEGLSDDGKYYVLAEMPASVAFLPKESTDEYEGYKIDWNKLQDEAEMKRIADANKKIANRMEKLTPNEFQPNLKYLEEIISSLKIEK